MPRPRLLIIFTALALLIFAPPALLLFGRFDRPTQRDRDNAAAFDKPIPPRADPGEPYIPPAAPPGELQRYGRGTLIRALALSPDARTVAAISTDNNLRTFALDGSSSTTFGVGSYGNYHAIAYTPDARRILAGPHGVPILWDTLDSQIHYLQSSYADAIRSIAIAPNGRSAVSGNANGNIRVWNLDTLSEIGHMATFDGGGNVIAIAYAPDGKRIHAASDLGDIRVYRLKSGRNLMARRYNLPWRVAAFSPDARLLLTGMSNGTVALYDVQDNGNQRLRFKAAVGPVTAVAFSPDASRFATASGLNVVLWETTAGKKLSELRAPGQRHVSSALAILPTNRHLLFGGDGISLLLMPSPATQPAK